MTETGTRRATVAATFLIRNRTRWAAALVLVTALGAWRASRLEFDLSFERFVLGDAPDDLTTAITETFGNTSGAYLVAILRGDDVFRAGVISAVRDITDELEAMPHLERVFGVATVPYIHGDREALSVQPLSALVDGGDVKPSELKAAMLASPLYTRRLVSADGKATVVLALVAKDAAGMTYRRPIIEAFEAAVRRHVPRGFEVLFTGYPIAEAEYVRLLWRGFVRAEMAAICLMALALLASFRTLPGVLLPLSTVGIATVWTLGFMEVTGQHVTLTSAGVPLMLLVIGVAEVSFFIARYYEEAAHGGSHELAVIRAAAGVIPPGLAAAAMTSAGFVALQTGHIGPTRDLGLAMGFGVLATVLVAAALVPSVFSLLRPPPERALRPFATGLVRALLQRVADLDVRHRRAVFVGSLALLGLGIIGGLRVNVAEYATRDLRSDDPLRIAQEVVDSELTGAFLTQAGIRARSGGPLDEPALFGRVEALERFLASQPGVVKAWSIVDYVKELDRAARPEGGAVRWPPDSNLIDQYLLLLSSGGPASDVSTLIEPAHRLATIVFGTIDLGTGEMMALHDRTQDFVRRELAGDVEVRFVGDYWQLSRGANSLVRDLVVGLLTAGALVFALVALFFRSWKLMLLSIPPNILPIVTAFGLIGSLGKPLRIGTSIVLPVSLGIAIDSTVQCLARLRHERALGRDYEAAVRIALMGTGRGMVFSALVLVAGFLCYFVPEFGVFHEVGLLASWTMLIALFANLFLTPSLVLSLQPLPAGSASPAEASEALDGRECGPTIPSSPTGASPA